MYSFGIYIYALLVRLAARFNRKAQLMVRGQRATWQLLREAVGNDRYVWFHAASLGEFEQGRPLIERLRREQPARKILLTFFSPSGYEVRKNYAGADLVCYLPFDTPRNARRFVRAARPEAAFFIKYEFWWNYLDELHKAGIPLYSVSSIFRERQIFFRWYGVWYRRALRRFDRFFVQDEASRALLTAIGIGQVTVAGDTRFDRVIDIMEAAKPLPKVERFVGTRPVVVAGSSWAADEDILIAYFNSRPDLKLVLAPHVVDETHLEEIERKLQRPSVRYSDADETSVAAADCLIIDCYGLLSSIYRYATVAYVGGGFGAGIHNVPEAAVYGVPVLIGPNNAKFREAQALLQNGGCFEIGTADDFNRVADDLLATPARLAQAGRAAADYIRGNAGAADIVYRTTLR